MPMRCRGGNQSWISQNHGKVKIYKLHFPKSRHFHSWYKFIGAASCATSVLWIWLLRDSSILAHPSKRYIHFLWAELQGLQIKFLLFWQTIPYKRLAKNMPLYGKFLVMFRVHKIGRVSLTVTGVISCFHLLPPMNRRLPCIIQKQRNPWMYQLNTLHLSRSVFLTLATWSLGFRAH